MEANSNSPAVVLTSGGLDSVTALYWAAHHAPPSDIYPLHIAYGQRHQVEQAAAEECISHLRESKIGGDRIKPLKVVRSDLGSLVSGVTSLSADSSLVPETDRTTAEMNEAGLPSVVVPCRNPLFLLYAMAYAANVKAGAVVIGAHADDAHGYPDCRPEFFKAFDKVMEQALPETEGQHRAHLLRPFVYHEKSKVISIGSALQVPVPYELTHTCYSPVEGMACGRCDSCIARRISFYKAGLPDPTRYHGSYLAWRETDEGIAQHKRELDAAGIISVDHERSTIFGKEDCASLPRRSTLSPAQKVKDHD